MATHPKVDEAEVALGRRFDSGALAPNSLDRLLERVQRANPLLVRATDVALIAATTILAVVDTTIWATDPVVDTGRLSTSIAIAVPLLGALAVAAVAIRRRRGPAALTGLAAVSIVVTTACLAIGTSLPPSFAATFALGVLTAGVLRREPGRPAVALAVLAGVAIASEALRPLVSGAGYLLVVGEAGFGLAVGIGLYLRWTDWRRIAAADAARTDERLAVARELHDLVGHHVAGIVVQAQAARHVAADHPIASNDALERIEHAGSEAMAALRQLLGSLREDSPAEAPTHAEDLEDLIAGALARGVPVQATIDTEALADAPALLPSVHRIIAESLTNVGRHARHVTRIDVSVRGADDCLEVLVRNDGVADAAHRSDTFGIVGMRERACSLGGSLTAGPTSGGGWLVRATLPIGTGP